MFGQGVQIKELLLAFAKHNIDCASICDSFLILYPVQDVCGDIIWRSKQKVRGRSKIRSMCLETQSKYIFSTSTDVVSSGNFGVLIYVMLNLFQHLTNKQIRQKDSNNIIDVDFAKSQILKQVQDDRGKCHSERSEESRKTICPSEERSDEESNKNCHAELVSASYKLTDMFNRHSERSEESRKTATTQRKEVAVC